jgi:hypothetical protein
MLWISVWMGNVWVTPEIKRILENEKFNAEQDHYFRTHIHFEGSFFGSKSTNYLHFLKY